MKHARTEAKEIVEKAYTQAEKGKEDIIATTKAQSQKLIEDAKIQIKQEKEKTIAEIKSEIGGLVVAAAEKVIEKNDEKKDKD